MTTARAQASRYEGVVDLRRYPIGAPASPAYLALVRACRDQLRDQGVAQLAGFLTPSAVTEMLAQAGRLAAQAWASDQAHTVYFRPPDGSAGPDHPRALSQHSAKKAIAYDLMPGRRRQAGQPPRHARGFPRPARPAPGHPGQRATPAGHLGADLRRAPRHEAEPAHPGTLLRPHRLTAPRSRAPVTGGAP